MMDHDFTLDTIRQVLNLRDTIINRDLNPKLTKIDNENLRKDIDNLINDIKTSAEDS